MESLVICFNGGAFSAILVISLCVVGVTLLYGLMYFLFVGGAASVVTPADVPLLTVRFDSDKGCGSLSNSLLLPYSPL